MKFVSWARQSEPAYVIHQFIFEIANGLRFSTCIIYTIRRLTKCESVI